jgi:hypothetical protein
MKRRAGMGVRLGAAVFVRHCYNDKLCLCARRGGRSAPHVSLLAEFRLRRLVLAQPCIASGENRSFLHENRSDFQKIARFFTVYHAVSLL